MQSCKKTGEAEKEVGEEPHVWPEVIVFPIVLDRGSQEVGRHTDIKAEEERLNRVKSKWSLVGDDCFALESEWQQEPGDVENERQKACSKDYAEDGPLCVDSESESFERGCVKDHLHVPIGSLV